MSLKNCQICNKKLIRVFKLGDVPLCDDLIKINSKKKNKLYPIIIKFCNNCKTAFNDYTVTKKILFPKNYHYRSRLTKDVLNGMKDFTEKIEKKYGKFNNKVVLDIGCNDGSLLNFFRDKGARTVGIEPTNAIKEAHTKHDLLVHDYFSKKVAKNINKKFSKIDFIVFTNVFAHINNFKELISNLKILISSKTKIIIENHYLGSVIKDQQFDTFYHEHPRTYSLTSFYFISKMLGMKMEDFEFPKRYGGNIRIYLNINKKIKKKKLSFFLKKEKNFLLDLKNLKLRFNIWKKNKYLELKKIYNSYGKIEAKGFPGRAAVILNLIDIQKYISCVYEKNNSPKVGHFVPGTRIPIIKDKILFDKKIKPKYILNLAWHIKKEIKNYLKENLVNSKMINIVDIKDFKI